MGGKDWIRSTSDRKRTCVLETGFAGLQKILFQYRGIDSIATREIGNDDKRRHTTTHRELIQHPNGAFVIDTPGMRELGMWDSGDGIDTAYANIEDLSRSCRYADCTHTSEPECAVLRALADGTLDAARLASYRKLKTDTYKFVLLSNNYTKKHVKTRRV